MKHPEGYLTPYQIKRRGNVEIVYNGENGLSMKPPRTWTRKGSKNKSTSSTKAFGFAFSWPLYPLKNVIKGGSLHDIILPCSRSNFGQILPKTSLLGYLCRNTRSSGLILYFHWNKGSVCISLYLFLQYFVPTNLLQVSSNYVKGFWTRNRKKNHGRTTDCAWSPYTTGVLGSSKTNFVWCQWY